MEKEPRIKPFEAVNLAVNTAVILGRFAVHEIRGGAGGIMQEAGIKQRAEQIRRFQQEYKERLGE